ncbi:uncharacterized protein LOC134235724, partial [Saccostrea cucullata]|uniref:uncharacterized protein LOC134235724 n=1 Tax=Saccostrea cuccullata TaxID=36930 RepID=UPI002ED30973
RFSILTDDEVSVLFCFLCSDSSSPNFNDTELLDLLIGVKQEVYLNMNPVTSQEAQRTLNRLKSPDYGYLWEDQDKLTKDTRDKTMDRVSSMNTDIPFWYSNSGTASAYLRSKGYNRKSGERCVIGVGCDSLLIHRLQMNILTHVTMEDTNIYPEICQILNVSNQMLKKGEAKRKDFLMDLRKKGKDVKFRRSLRDSVDHVTWLWRYGLYARPDIVRSCIGLYPHNDIYIIDNKAYRKLGKQQISSEEVRCLLYCLLLAENYQLRVNEQSNNSTKEAIRERYFPDITYKDLVELPSGIAETRDGVITFISDDIRHDVMYAFVTECLVEDSDLEFFLTMASRDVISEYCRSWDYRRSEKERCLYVPERPEKMYDLFIDKLQLDIISHCTVSDNRIHERVSKKCKY